MFIYRRKPAQGIFLNYNTQLPCFVVFFNLFFERGQEGSIEIQLQVSVMEAFCFPYFPSFSSEYRVSLCLDCFLGPLTKEACLVQHFTGGQEVPGYKGRISILLFLGHAHQCFLCRWCQSLVTDTLTAKTECYVSRGNGTACE